MYTRSSTGEKGMGFMWIRALATVTITIVVGALAGVAFAQFAEPRTAGGIINVTTASVDLYICEPGNKPGGYAGQS